MANAYPSTSAEERISLRAPPASLNVQPDVIITCPEDSHRRMIRWLIDKYHMDILGCSQGQIFTRLSPELSQSEQEHPDLSAYAAAWEMVAYPAGVSPDDAEKLRVQRIALFVRRICDDVALATIGSLLRLYPVAQCTTTQALPQFVDSLLPNPTDINLRLAASPRGLDRQLVDVIPEHVALTPSLHACTHFLMLLRLTQAELEVPKGGHRRGKTSKNAVKETEKEESEHMLFACLVAKAFWNDFFAWKQRLESKTYNTGKPEGWVPVSRAYHKMSEACLRRPLPACTRDPPAGCMHARKGLDVGAAPGGWSQYMADHCQFVLGVDPGDLTVEHHPYDASIPTDQLRGIYHLANRFENCAEALTAHGPFDVCACDMNVERKLAYEFVKLVTPHLAMGGRLVLTIKMTVKSHFLTPVIREVQDNLRSWGYGNITTVHLFANKKQEFTIIADRISTTSLLQHEPAKPLHDDLLA